MNTLSNKELYEVKGGGFHWALWVGIGAAFSFLAGVVDGIMNPIKCN